MFFNYAVETNSPSDDRFLASAVADIDNDATPQRWGYAKGSQDGKDHKNSLGSCTRAALGVEEQVAKCTPDSGNSVF